MAGQHPNDRNENYRKICSRNESTSTKSRKFISMKCRSISFLKNENVTYYYIYIRGYLSQSAQLDVQFIPFAFRDSGKKHKWVKLYDSCVKPRRHQIFPRSDLEKYQNRMFSRPQDTKISVQKYLNHSRVNRLKFATLQLKFSNMFHPCCKSNSLNTVLARGQSWAIKEADKLPFRRLRLSPCIDRKPFCHDAPALSPLTWGWSCGLLWGGTKRGHTTLVGIFSARRRVAKRSEDAIDTATIHSSEAMPGLP